MRFIVISGLSGAGKSVALNTLEDHHYYCIDNMPLELLDEFTTRLLSHSIKLGDKIALSIDTRNLVAQSTDIKGILERLAAGGFDSELIFIRASRETLEQRYNETRRPHPLSIQHNKPLEDCINAEIDLLASIAEYANARIDTTGMNQYELQHIINRRLALEPLPLSVLLKSFGYKKGIPENSDYIFDVRCLSNPYWVADLREQTGTSAAVRDFLDQSPGSQAVFDDLFGFLHRCLPRYESDMRAYLTLSIGCTGGRHRSVYMVEKLYQKLVAARPQYDISKEHRDI